MKKFKRIIINAISFVIAILFYAMFAIPHTEFAVLSKNKILRAFERFWETANFKIPNPF